MKLLSVLEFAVVTVMAIGISLAQASFCGVMPIISAVLVIAFGIRPLQVTAAEPNPQYELGDIKIPAASADEEKREAVSIPLALDYLEKGTQVWNGHRKCVTCHTNGIYMTVRPVLSGQAGKTDRIGAAVLRRDARSTRTAGEKEVA